MLIGLLPAKWIDSRETPSNRDQGRLEENPRRQGQGGEAVCGFHVAYQKAV